MSRTVTNNPFVVAHFEGDPDVPEWWRHKEKGCRDICCSGKAERRLRGNRRSREQGKRDIAERVSHMK